MEMKREGETGKALETFLNNKSEKTVQLFNHLVRQFREIRPIDVWPAKSMIGIATPRRRIAWVTQLGRNFVHVVIPFREAYGDNLCFVKIVRVPGDDKQFNHHFRMLECADVNEEMQRFMRLAYDLGK